MVAIVRLNVNLGLSMVTPIPGPSGNRESYVSRTHFRQFTEFNCVRRATLSASPGDRAGASNRAGNRDTLAGAQLMTNLALCSSHETFGSRAHRIWGFKVPELSKRPGLARP